MEKNTPISPILPRRLASLLEGEHNCIANLANASALLYEQIDNINWAGFYLLQEEELVLGPFQGRVACVHIALGKGVCGTAAYKDQTLVVDNVHKFSGHIACDSASNSEIVIPLHAGGKVAGVLDIDSPSFSRFSAEDKKILEHAAQLIESSCDLSVFGSGIFSGK